MATIELPKFRKSARQQQWVSSELRTARFIKALWQAAGPKQRRDGEFITLLVKCAWTNVREDGSGHESTRRWRNNHIARYLRVSQASDRKLAETLTNRFPTIKLRSALSLIQSHTGIAHYYKSLRPETLQFIHRHAAAFTKCFETVSSTRLTAEHRIVGVIDLLAKIGGITIRGRNVSPLNSTTPALACLDSGRRFPIMNERTTSLLRAIGAVNDRDGAVALSALIGKNGVENAFELDVYALTEDFSKVKPPRRLKLPADFRDIGIKSELASFAQIARKSVRIAKRHNELTNRLRDYLLWRHVVPKESRFDAFVLNWKKDRHLLIEAKTSSAGPAGRSQVRQAIGQLFDYRFTHFPGKAVDLAVLLPSKPATDIGRLLKTLHIECLWFEGRRIRGTVDL